MIYFSLERFLNWLPFLTVGLIISISLVYYFQVRERKFSVPGSIYSFIAKIMVPSNIFTIISMDLYFLIKGDVFFSYVNNDLKIILIFYLSFFSLLVSIQASGSIFHTFQISPGRRYRLSMLVLIISFVTLMSEFILHIHYNFGIFSLIPVISFSIGLISGISLQVRKPNPISYFVFPISVLVLSIFYLALFIYLFY